MNDKKSRPAGFASGAFRPLGIGIEEAMEWNAVAGGTAFEITFGTIEEMREFRPTQKITNMRERLQHFSVHLPFKGISSYDSATCVLVAEAFAPIARDLYPDAAVVHVELVDDLNALVALRSSCGVPIAIENADCRKAIADETPVFFEAHKKGFLLVYDIAHDRSRVSELGEDPKKWTTLLAKGEAMASSLSHIHASANKPGGSHRMLSQDKDCFAIRDALEEGSLEGKPVILEGPLEEATAKALSDELSIIFH